MRYKEPNSGRSRTVALRSPWVAWAWRDRQRITSPVGIAGLSVVFVNSFEPSEKPKQHQTDPIPGDVDGLEPAHLAVAGCLAGVATVEAPFSENFWRALALL